MFSLTPVNGGAQDVQENREIHCRHQDRDDRDECYWQIDRAFEEEQISFEDHELLYGLSGMVEVA